MAKNIIVSGLVDESITDGAGLRYVLFVQGCPRRCKGCHNEKSLEFLGGTQMSAEQVMAEVAKNPILSGVTLSGGEPFSQAEALVSLAQAVKKKKMGLAAYTGYTFEELLASADPFVLQLLSLVDVLVDGPYIEEQRDLALKFKGSHNQRILDVQKSLKASQAVTIDWSTDINRKLPE